MLRGKDQLARAIEECDVSAVRAALDAGADVNVPMDEDHTPLSYAAWKNQLDIVRVLLASGADYEAIPMLLDTCTDSHLAVAQVLLEAGADVNARREGDGNALTYAAEEGARQMMRLFIDAGADLNVPDCLEERTPLSWAILNEDAETALLLIELGAEVETRNANGFTPFLSACARGLGAVCAALLEAGAQPDVLTPEGLGPIELARENGHEALVSWLESQGVDHGPLAIDDEFRARYRTPSAPDLLPGAESIVASVAQIKAWVAAHPFAAFVPVSPGIAAGALAELAPHLQGWGWPPPVAALLRAANGNLPIGEYESLSAEAIVDHWRGLLQLFREGVFDRARPHADNTGLVHPVWWHPGLLPFARDGGGNQICIDLDPGPDGAPGQIVWWEIRGGPHVDVHPSLVAFLEAYARRLASGRYDDESTFEDASAWDLTRG